MTQFSGISRVKFSSLLLLAGLVGISTGYANPDLVEGQKSKELVEEMKLKEVELREETKKKIIQTRELALKHLEKAWEQYLSQNKQPEADMIAKEINQLRGKLGMPPLASPAGTVDKEPAKVSDDKGSSHVKYNTNYLFNKDGLIKGKLIFMPDKKVKIDYNYKGKDASAMADWKDMGDHIQVEADSVLGQILISTSPSSNQKSLFIRWGGELTHKLTDAHAQ